MTPSGNSFIAFQQAILDLHGRGIILAINSQNNYEEAMSVIRTHPNMILKEHHFSAFRINWNNKAENLKEIARELNIGVDSMVFIDDDPTNRALVRDLLPEVAVPEIPENPSQYAKFLVSLPHFEAQAVTNEDRLRGNFYVTERLRKEAEKNYQTKEDFLHSLELELLIYKNELSSATRLAQLTEKTNQFNVDKQPMSEDAICTYMVDDVYQVFHARAIDKFGDHGIIAFALIKTFESHWHIQSFLLICRVLARGIEDSFLFAIYKQAHIVCVQRLTISFKKNDRNIPAENFVNKNFDSGVLKVDQKNFPPPWIKIHYENF